MGRVEDPAGLGRGGWKAAAFWIVSNGEGNGKKWLRKMLRLFFFLPVRGSSPYISSVIYAKKIIILPREYRCMERPFSILLHPLRVRHHY